MLRPDEMARIDADSESQSVDDLAAEFWRGRDPRAGELEAEIIASRERHPGDDRDDETGGDARA
jgi:hypothetical protein